MHTYTGAHAIYPYSTNRNTNKVAHTITLLRTEDLSLVHMRTFSLIWHSETHVVTAQGMPGNSFKGMLIFQMLLDINKPPNQRAEI